MKCSTGVAICAVLILIGSAMTLMGAAAMAFMFLGPMSGQLFDPAALPPGANVQFLRATGLVGALVLSSVGALGIATGIGLIRLWRWARYSAIVLSGAMVLFSLLPGIAMLLIPIPPPTSNPNGIPDGFRFVMAGFYLLWAAIGAVFLYVFARRSTAAQFDGGVVDTTPRARPLSVSIIAWFMIVSAAMGLPMMALARFPAFFLGILLMGGLAKAFYIVYFSVYVLFGIGLLKRTAEAIGPTIALHVLAAVNALVMLVPSAWLRYQNAIGSMTFMGGTEPNAATMAWSRYFAVGVGVLTPAIILFFLTRARRTLATAAAAGQ